MLFRNEDARKLWDGAKSGRMSESQQEIIAFVERWAALIESKMVTIEGTNSFSIHSHLLIDDAREADTAGLTENELETAINLAAATLAYGSVLKEVVSTRAIYGSGK